METCTKKEGIYTEAAPFRTIQIHPTRRCNLSCLHCYSSSSPHLKEMLDINALKDFLAFAFEQGFNNIAMSGGEPLLYKDLEELLRFTKSIGYHNSMASNGMLLCAERNQRILQYVDLIAVSIDGQEPLHDYIRGQKGAFKKMCAGVEVLHRLNKPFGFIHTATSESWQYLGWLGSFAYDNGAKLLQIHPLERHGRATQKLAHFQWNDDLLAHRIYILANYLRSKFQQEMVVQVDLLHRDYLEAFPQIVNGFARDCANKDRLSEVIDTIVIEETGRIIPFAYGFDPGFTIGNVHHFDPGLFNDYLTEKSALIAQLLSATLEKVFNNKDVDVINWNEIFVYESLQQYNTYEQL